MPKNNISHNTPEYIPPDSALESFARRILPAIQAYYDSEEGQSGDKRPAKTGLNHFGFGVKVITILAIKKARKH